MLRLDDAAGRQEDDVYRELGETWARIGALVKEGRGAHGGAAGTADGGAR